MSYPARPRLPYKYYIIRSDSEVYGTNDAAAARLLSRDYLVINVGEGVRVQGNGLRPIKSLTYREPL